MVVPGAHRPRGGGAAGPIRPWVQRYENMNTAHGADCGKWPVFGIASATPLFSKMWAWWSDNLNTYSQQ